MPCTYAPETTSGYVTPSTVNSGATLTVPTSGPALAGAVTVRGFVVAPKKEVLSPSQQRSVTVPTPDALDGIAASQPTGTATVTAVTPASSTAEAV